MPQSSSELPDAHFAFGLRVGAGIDQQPHAVNVTVTHGVEQRRRSFLRIGFRPPHTHNINAIVKNERAAKTQSEIWSRELATNMEIC